MNKQKLKERDHWMKIKSRIETLLQKKDDIDKFGQHGDLPAELLVSIEDLREAFEEAK